MTCSKSRKPSWQSIAISDGRPSPSTAAASLARRRQRWKARSTTTVSSSHPRTRARRVGTTRTRLLRGRSTSVVGSDSSGHRCSPQHRCACRGTRDDRFAAVFWPLKPHCSRRRTDHAANRLKVNANPCCYSIALPRRQLEPMSSCPIGPCGKVSYLCPPITGNQGTSAPQPKLGPVAPKSGDGSVE
jgi:hypothetical protein